MSEASPIRCETSSRGVATLTLNRPDKGNAYNQVMLDALSEDITRLSADSAVRVVVLRASGRHFCVGAEIGATQPPAAQGRPRTTIPDICYRLDTIPKPTIAVVHGACIGGGVALVSACDMAIAARDAFFALPEVRLGFAPGPLIPFFLRAMEPRSLRRYFMSGERFPAAEAMRIGLVHDVCDPDALDAVLSKLIDETLLGGPNAIAQVKTLLRELAGTPVTKELLAGLQIEFETGFHSTEADEGRTSFREKRKPAWYVEREIPGGSTK